MTFSTGVGWMLVVMGGAILCTEVLFEIGFF